MMKRWFLFLLPCVLVSAPVEVGVDVLFKSYGKLLVKKRVGLITNQTGISSDLQSTIDLFRKNTHLVALFSPEHGIKGAAKASAKIDHSKAEDGIAIYSLHGETIRPTSEMLEQLDILVYDIQEIGCRSYTYISTLFCAMEEAAKHGVAVMVLDRPNPMGGIVVDGPMLNDTWRSFLGYINVPYCHGMTIGELARFFNEEYKIGCKLDVIAMKGWKRSMLYRDTGLYWVPTSPYIPEPDTPFYYATTGILGSLGIVNIGIGYTLPFKVVGAPWIEADHFANQLNAQKLPGVKFLPFHYTPHYGKFKSKLCEGVQIVITDPHRYRPLAVQYMLIGLLKSLYPSMFQKSLATVSEQTKLSFCKVNGNSDFYAIIEKEPYFAWKLIGYDQRKREVFIEKRKKYLMYE